MQKQGKNSPKPRKPLQILEAHSHAHSHECLGWGLPCMLPLSSPHPSHALLPLQGLFKAVSDFYLPMACRLNSLS